MQEEKTLGRVVVRELREKSVNEAFESEDFWAGHFALVKKYLDLKRRVLLNEGKTISSINSIEDELSHYVTNIILGTPKYSGIFVVNGEGNKENYINALPTEFKDFTSESEEGLALMCERVIAYAVENGLTSKSSGINVNSNKYRALMGEFERDKAVLSEEFLSLIEAKYGKEGRDNTLSHVREKGLLAIEELLDFYGKDVDYWCDFLSNIEIARQKEGSEAIV